MTEGRGVNSTVINCQRRQSISDMLAGHGGGGETRDKGFPWDVFTCSQAALYGHLELIQWMREQGNTMTPRCILAVVVQSTAQVNEVCFERVHRKR